MALTHEDVGDGVCMPTSLVLAGFTHFVAGLHELFLKQRFGTSSMFWGEFINTVLCLKYNVVTELFFC